MAYRTLQVEPGEVEPRVLELWRNTRRNQVELENTFRWYYRSDAQRDNRCFVLQHGASGDKRLVGATGLGSRAFSVGGAPVNAGLLGDFFVDKAHRSLFPALSLQRAAAESARPESAFVYGFPNEKALPVFRRLGFAELGIMQRYVLVLDYRHYLARRLGRPSLPRGAAPLLNGLLRLRAPRALLPDPRCEALWLPRFDERFDVLDAAQQLDVHIRGARGSSFLNWRFVAKPGSSARILALRARTGQQLVAYAVVELENETAHLRDLSGRTLPDLVAMLRSLERHVRRLPARSISFNVLGAPRLRRALESLGYRARASNRKVICSPGARAPKAVRRLTNEHDWYLTDADEDQ